MRALRPLLMAVLLLVFLGPVAGASPGSVSACIAAGAEPSVAGLGSAGACIQTLEAGTDVPLYGGACAWVDPVNGTWGVDPSHNCGLNSA